MLLLQLRIVLIIACINLVVKASGVRVLLAVSRVQSSDPGYGFPWRQTAPACSVAGADSGLMLAILRVDIVCLVFHGFYRHAQLDIVADQRCQ